MGSARQNGLIGHVFPKNPWKITIKREYLVKQCIVGGGLKYFLKNVHPLLLVSKFRSAIGGFWGAIHKITRLENSGIHTLTVFERDNFGDKLMKLMCDDQDNRMKMFGY